MYFTVEFPLFTVVGRLRGFQLIQSIYLVSVRIAQVKVLNPFWVTSQHKLGGPRIRLAFALGACETIDIRTVFGQQHEIMQVVHYQSGLVVGPYRRRRPCKFGLIGWLEFKKLAWSKQRRMISLLAHILGHYQPLADQLAAACKGIRSCSRADQRSIALFFQNKVASARIFLSGNLAVIRAGISS